MKALDWVLRVIVLMSALTLIFVALWILHIPLPWDAKGIMLPISAILYSFVIVFMFLSFSQKLIKKLTTRWQNLVLIISIALSMILVFAWFFIVLDPTVISPY